ncbi:MAG: hypothetical protein HUU47_03785 [Bacteroidetes bacterium]|nr:hypothetical protein [Bacteroidota bacterium]
MDKKSNLILFLVIVLATFSRLFITIPNFSAIGSLALFCGAIVGRKKFSFLIPFAALLVGDLMMAGTGKLYSDYFFQGYFLWVYFAFFITWLIGKAIKDRFNFKNLLLASLLSSVSFFLISNFGSWLQLGFYPKNLAGLIEAYIAGISFYKNDLLSNFFLNQLAGDLFFNSVFYLAFFVAFKRLEASVSAQRV